MFSEVCQDGYFTDGPWIKATEQLLNAVRSAAEKALAKKLKVAAAMFEEEK